MKEQVELHKKDVLHTVKTLSAALPYIQRFAGKTVVVKYGGNAMVDIDAVSSFAQDVALLAQVGIKIIVVHGGGPQIGKRLQELKIESAFENGLRITDQNTLAVVQMVLLGEVNPQLVAMLLRKRVLAIGLNGIDGHLLSAEKLLQQNKDQQKKFDIGFVGDIVSVNDALLTDLLNAGYMPVIAPIGTDSNGQRYNINADTVASRVASAVQAEKVIFMTNAPGVMNEKEKLITGLSVQEITTLMQESVITGGMRPKVEAALFAVKSGVSAAHIIDGRLEHALLLELLTDKGVGTLIKL